MSRRHRGSYKHNERNAQVHDLIMGRNCIEEVLKHCPERLERAYLAESRDIDGVASGARRESIATQLAKKGVEVEYLSRQELDSLVNSDSHQGVIAKVSPRPLLRFEDVVSLAESTDNIRLLVLDGVLDPQNFGAVLRSAECFGVHAVLWSKNRGAPLGPVVSKASVGASELLPLCPVSNIHQSLEVLKRSGVWTVGAVVAPDATPLRSFEFPQKTALIMGSEGDGIQPLVEKNLDFRVFISMEGVVSSLNVSQATTLMLYALHSQRPNKGDVKVA